MGAETRSQRVTPALERNPILDFGIDRDSLEHVGLQPE